MNEILNKHVSTPAAYGRCHQTRLQPLREFHNWSFLVCKLLCKRCHMHFYSNLFSLIVSGSKLEHFTCMLCHSTIHIASMQSYNNIITYKMVIHTSTYPLPVTSLGTCRGVFGVPNFQLLELCYSSCSLVLQWIKQSGSGPV